MRWDEFRRSANVEDARGGGLGGGMPVGAGGLGIGTIVVVGLLGWALGIDPSVLLGVLNGEAPSSTYQAPTTTGRGTPDDRTGQFVAAVLGDTEARWSEI